MNNAAANRSLDVFMHRVESLPSVIEEIAVRGAEIVRAEIASNILRGVAPNGTPWPATEDGHAPLANAMGAVTVGANGNRIRAEVAAGSVEERHHLGEVRGGKRRQIIPTELSATMRAGLESAAAEATRTHMERS